jgi:acyl homoserine lactone synthase
MIVVIEKHNAHRYPHLIEAMFRLRARVFCDRLGWDVEVACGQERDKYDDAAPVYLIYADDEGRDVKGSLRLLPTTGPTLLADLFSDTVPDAVELSAPTIWECTRFCLDDRILDKEQRLFASAVLIAALGEIAIAAGIESIIANFDSTMLRLYRRIGCEVEVLGATSRYGRPIYLGLFAVSEPTLHRIKARMLEARRPVAPAREASAAQSLTLAPGYALANAADCGELSLSVPAFPDS